MVDLLKDKECPEKFDVTEMRPNNTDKQTADELGRISEHFPPLERNELNIDDPSHYEPLQYYQVAQRLKTSKKTKSTVHCDIVPASLVNDYSKILAIPLTPLYNSVFRSGIWPKKWKQERVTVIPTCKAPEEFGQLRNLSCTPFFSKMLEFFVLEGLKKGVQPKGNQYGGLKGCGTNQYLIDAWDFILRAMDNEKGPAVNLISVDYAKAFNTMKHRACLSQFERLGATDLSLKMIFVFLQGRSMQVRVNDELSDLRPVPDGSPQGMILGNYLFVITMNNLIDTLTNPAN